MWMQKGFWSDLALPIVGLSPMDGVTDAPMRFIAKKYGNPSVVYTEFVSAEGLWRIKKRGEMDHKIWKDLLYCEEDRPVVAQIFGSDPESFYEAAKIVCDLGFDGIDINMGCPSPGLEKRGGGAGLIRDKCNAVEVVEATRRGVRDFFGSDQSNFSTRAHDLLRQNSTAPAPSEILPIPVSLKTRIGSAAPDRKWWELIASMQMPLVAMHGRTFKQLYSGFADWNLLIQAAEIIRESGSLFLGNGDVKELKNSRALELKILTTGDQEIDLTGKMDGVLVGRSVIGNPWVLRSDGYIPTIGEKLAVAVEHSKKFEELLPASKFFVMRKHLARYLSGFDGAQDLRKQAMLLESADGVSGLLQGEAGNRFDDLQ